MTRRCRQSSSQTPMRPLRGRSGIRRSSCPTARKHAGKDLIVRSRYQYIGRLLRRGRCAGALTARKVAQRPSDRVRVACTPPYRRPRHSRSCFSEMRTPLDQSVRMQMWIAVIAICLLAGSAMVAIIRSIAVSYASSPGGTESSEQGAAPDGSVGGFATEPQSVSEAAQTPSSRRRPATCRECGVIKSIVSIERDGDVSGAEDAHVKNAGSEAGRRSGTGGKRGSYDVTVRFRDGSTMVLSEATPRSWVTGSRVIAIAGASASVD